MVNGVHHSINNVTSTTTTDVLPEIKTGDTVSGSAVLHLTGGGTRTAQLEVTSIGLENNLKFKVPYNYTAYGLTGTQVASGTYYARDGINLAAYTDESISGWLCSDGTMHYGSYVSGVRGDIRLDAQLDASAALQFSVSSTTLYSENYDADTATITLLSTADGPFTLAYDNELISCTGSGPWTVEINDSPGLVSGMKTWFEDDTEVPVTITDTSTGRMGTVRFMLKNKYSYSISDASGNPCTNVSGNAAGTQISFATAKAAVTTVPTGRTIVAFENTATNAVYKGTDFPITLNDTLDRRSISLKAILNFTSSLSDGGYGTTASPLSSQTGTSTNPYLLNYYGTDTNKNNQIELEISDNKCADSALTIGSTQTAIVSATFDITHTGNKFLIKIKPTLAENSVYTSGTIKLTITDPTTGAKKDIHVLLKKVPSIDIADLGTYLDGLTPNAPSTKYTLPEITGLDASNYTQIKTQLLSHTGIYVDLSATELPSGITNMSYAFKGCSTLVKAPQLPDTAQNLLSCFENCTNLIEPPEIPPSVTSLNMTFSECTSLTTVPDLSACVNLTNLVNTFGKCYALTDASGLTIPDSVTGMGSCFAGCKNMTAAPVIPAGVTDMSSCFLGCQSLTGNIVIKAPITDPNGWTSAFKKYIDIGALAPTNVTIYVPAVGATGTDVIDAIFNAPNYGNGDNSHLSAGTYGTDAGVSGKIIPVDTGAGQTWP